MKPLTLTVGPFTGMRDTIDPGATVTGLASLLQNVYPVDPLAPSAVVGRPGATLSGTKRAGTVQLVGQFTKLAGTEITYCIAGGTFYTFDWNARSWTNTLTAANLSGASITLDASALCSSVVLADKLVISDGVNTPWMWDGTAGAGLTKLTQCPVLYGPPTVYYAKLFGIKATDRRTIVWSEESDPTLGYDFAIGTYPNYWQLGQTDQESLTALVGTNSSLVYFRAASAGAIHGPVTASFVNDGVHDGVSGTVGTISPYAVLLRNRSIYFLDNNGRPHVLNPGTVPTPLWSDAAETLRTVPRSVLGAARSVDYPGCGLVLFALAEVSQTVPNLVLAYNPEGDRLVGFWRGWTITSLALVKNGSGVPVVMHGDNAGYVFDHANPQDQIWSDTVEAGKVAISHLIVTNAVGYSPKYATSWSRADYAFRLSANLTSLQLSYDTPRGTSTPLSTSPGGGFAVWGGFLWGTGVWASGSVEKHVTAGLQASQCRWIKLRISHAVLDEPFGFMQATLDGSPGSSSPTLT